jgi:hypothetical protein
MKELLPDDLSEAVIGFIILVIIVAIMSAGDPKGRG